MEAWMLAVIVAWGVIAIINVSIAEQKGIASFPLSVACVLFAPLTYLYIAQTKSKKP
jgi:hypothetical protein